MTYQHSRLRRTAKRTDEREGWVSLRAAATHAPVNGLTNVTQPIPSSTEQPHCSQCSTTLPEGTVDGWRAGLQGPGVGGSRTTSSPSTPSVGPGRSRAAYRSGAVLESRSRQPTLPREPQQANTRDLGSRVSQNRDRSAKGAGVQSVRRGKREVRPEARLAVASPRAAARSGAHSRPSGTAAIWI
jgi:hypothetical protein